MSQGGDLIANNNNIKQIQINGTITARTVRLLNEQGVQLGVVPIEEARNLALVDNLDLVRIGGSSDVPVCKIMNYGKYCFECDKKKKKTRQRQKSLSVIKEIRLSVNIGIGDLATKANKVKEFVDSGNKVKVSVKLKGRENSRPDIGRNVLLKFMSMCSEFAAGVGDIVIESRHVVCFLVKKNQIEASDQFLLKADVMSDLPANDPVDSIQEQKNDLGESDLNNPEIIS
ncbi:MAG: translation initiation factor IF-3 [Candidatus Improbicoccus devescovinae]|nr:MAG: translation initiation factor IF-3 [Candidatus Improbicoccus devescovinae]